MRDHQRRSSQFQVIDSAQVWVLRVSGRQTRTVMKTRALSQRLSSSS